MDDTTYLTLWDGSGALIWASAWAREAAPSSTLGRLAWEMAAAPDRAEVRAAFAGVLGLGVEARFTSGTVFSSDRFRSRILPLPHERLGSPAAMGVSVIISHARLSRKESQVLAHLGRGRAVAEVAAAMRIAPSTVQSHIGALRRKLELPTLPALVSYATRARLRGDPLPALPAGAPPRA